MVLFQRAHIPLGGLLAMALFLRLWTVQESLWLDELHTSWAVSGTFRDVAPRAALGNQSPLYFWVIWLVTQVAGHSEATLRGWSIVCGTALVGGIAGCTYIWTRSVPLAHLAALVAAIDPHYLFFARDARPYAMLQLLALLQIALTELRFRDTLGLPANQSSRYRWPWRILTWLLFYTHYTSMLLLPAEAAALWIVLPHWRRREFIRRGLLELAIVVSGCLLAVPHVMFVFQRRDQWRSFVHVQPLQRMWSILPATAYVLVPAVIACVVRFGGRCLSNRRLNQWSEMTPRVQTKLRTTLLVCCTFVPILLAWLATYRRLDWGYSGIAPLFFRRYLVVAMVPLALLSAWCGVLLRTELGRTVFAILCAVAIGCYWSSTPASLWTRHSGEDWPAVIELIQADADTSHWPILLRAGLIEDNLLGPDASPELKRYCQFPFRGLYQFSNRQGPIISLPSRRELEANDWTKWQQRTLARTPGMWLVSRGDSEKAERCFQRLRATLHRSGQKIARRETFDLRGIQVVRVELRRSGRYRFTRKSVRSIDKGWAVIRCANNSAVAGAR